MPTQTIANQLTFEPVTHHRTLLALKGHYDLISSIKLSIVTQNDTSIYLCYDKTERNGFVILIHSNDYDYFSSVKHVLPRSVEA